MRKFNIKKILTEYEINPENESEHNIIYNYNATNPDDVHEEDQEDEHEVNYLDIDSEVHLTEINEDNIFDSQSQTQDLLLLLQENPNENVSLPRNSGISRQNPIQLLDNESTHSSSPPSRPTTPHNVVFVSDNASDITKALSRIGGYQRFGCAGHHLNLVGQAGFKQVQAAASLVKRCKQIVEHIKSSGPANYLLIEYQKDFEMPLLKVLQQNNTRWWSILIMMERILTNYNAITMALVGNNKSSLILTPYDQTNMRAIVTLLRPFQECGEVLSSENDVTISLIVPYFKSLKEHLSPKPDDLKMIKDMKVKMLLKLNNRYNTQQLTSLTFATLLDVRHKNDFLANFEQLKTALQNLLANQQEQQPSQNEIPATEGQQLENLSAIGRSHKKSIFAYKDDEVRDEPSDQWDAILLELNTYKNVRLSAAQKEKINVLSWWKKNKNQFPHIFQFVRSNLHIPATSVPSERIFSLAGYIVRDRRSKILSRNVNKAIFLKKNAKHIPPQTTVFSPPT